MALAAKISAAELSAQVTDRFLNQYFEGRLINAPGTSYTPGTTDDATFLGNEVTLGTGGYVRQTFYYDTPDIATYSDGGVGLAQKATIFSHDGGGTAINFTHVALVWSTGNITGLVATASSVPSAGNDGTYTNIPVDSTSGSGTGAEVNITISNSGAAATDYAVTLAKPGLGYAASDTITISDGTLAGLGAITGGAGFLTISVDTVNTATNAGDLLTVAQTTNAVTLGGGNEAAFYWNLKQYGYYESLLAVV